MISKSKVSGAIWLGNYKSALDPKFLSENDITVIVNCSVDIPFINDVLDKQVKGLELFRIPVYDSLLEHDINVMEYYFLTVLPFILKKMLTEKKNVLIHCHLGAQRSAIVVAALLFVLVDSDIMKFPSIPNGSDKSKLMKEVTRFILKKRPRVFSYGFRINFKTSLERFFKVKLS